MKTCYLSLLFLMLSLPACYYDVEEEIYPILECDTQNVSYSGVVLNIISNNCYSCHDANSNFGNVTLEGYTALKTYVDNGKLLGVIRHEAGFSPMPQNQPQLVECNIAKIEAWIDAGAPDN
jgi:hypothetical protein